MSLVIDKGSGFIPEAIVRSVSADSCGLGGEVFLPLLIKDGFSCLIIGGGRVASRKIEMLLQIPCSLTIVAPQIADMIAEAVKRKSATWVQREYAPGDCEGFQLIIAATPKREVNRQVFSEAKRLGIPVNVVDDPELSTVIFPAIWRDGSLLVSVSTEGSAPFMSQAIRDMLAGWLSQLGKWVKAGGRFRQAVRSSVTDEEQKRHLYERFLEAVRHKRLEDAPGGTDLRDWLAWLNRIEKERSDGCHEL
jgi:uroporphyrin-III C-methyltransferase/precorrin-2 dehydrogenase/sirohydrochlorin ferrochelatase